MTSREPTPVPSDVVDVAIQAFKEGAGEDYGDLRPRIEAVVRAIASLASVQQPPTGESDREAWRPIETLSGEGKGLFGYWTRTPSGATWNTYVRDLDDAPLSATHWLPLPEPPASSASQRG